MSRASSLRTMWDGRTDTWHEHVNASPGFERVRDELVAAAAVRPDERVIDLGAGTGFVALAVAPSAAEVVGVDLSVRMLDVLRERARQSDLKNVSTTAADLAEVDFPRGSANVVVSNYALHHLEDADKRAVVERARSWLVPGGRIVIADMMFGRGKTVEDRRIIRQKVVSLLKKGPGGAWRVGKNAVRFGLRRGTELPASPEFWVRTLTAAGFVDVAYRPIVAEAGLVTGRVPGL